MNNDRRAALSKLADDLRDIESKIEELMNEEQDYLDNMPENMQDGEKAQKAQAAVDAMESALGEVQCAISSLDEAQE